MRIELGAPVVIAEGPKLHLPCERRRQRSRGRRWARVALTNISPPPPRWPTLCGLEGTVWVYAGLARRRGREAGFCLVCVARAGPEARVGAREEEVA